MPVARTTMFTDLVFLLAIDLFCFTRPISRFSPINAGNVATGNLLLLIVLRNRKLHTQPDITATRLLGALPLMPTQAMTQQVSIWGCPIKTSTTLLMFSRCSCQTIN